jgi:hypothetical protein
VCSSLTRAPHPSGAPGPGKLPPPGAFGDVGARKVPGPTPRANLSEGIEARRVIRLKYAAHPGFKILLFLAQSAFRFEYEPLP